MIVDKLKHSNLSQHSREDVLVKKKLQRHLTINSPTNMKIT